MVACNEFVICRPAARRIQRDLLLCIYCENVVICCYFLSLLTINVLFVISNFVIYLHSILIVDVIGIVIIIIINNNNKAFN